MSGSGDGSGDGGNSGGHRDWRSSPFLTAPEPKLGVGWAVSTTLAVLRRNLVPLGLLGVLFAGLPNAAIDAASLPSLVNGWLGFDTDSRAGTPLADLPASALQALLSAGAVAVVTADLAGRRIGFGASLAALPRLAVQVMSLHLLSLLGAALGVVLLVVPGSILAVTWMVALPVRAVEGPGIRHAFARSAELVGGSLWRCAALLLIYAAAMGLVGGLAVVAGVDLGSGPVGILADATLMTVAGILQAVGSAVAYVGLRRLRDGEEPAQVSFIFS